MARFALPWACQPCPCSGAPDQDRSPKPYSMRPVKLNEAAHSAGEKRFYHATKCPPMSITVCMACASRSDKLSGNFTLCNIQRREHGTDMPNMDQVDVSKARACFMLITKFQVLQFEFCSMLLCKRSFRTYTPIKHAEHEIDVFEKRHPIMCV